MDGWVIIIKIFLSLWTDSPQST